MIASLRLRRVKAILLAMLLALPVLVAWNRASHSAPAADARIGRKIEDFTLNDFRGASRSLADWSKAKLVVVAFLGTECPLANLYAPRLAELPESWAGKGVAFLGINSNQQDSITEVARPRAAAQAFRFPFSRIPAIRSPISLARCARPKCSCSTPDRVVRYRGRIDDQFGIGYQKKEAVRNDLRVRDRRAVGRQRRQPADHRCDRLLDRPREAPRALGRGDLFEPGGADPARTAASNVTTRVRSRRSR